MLCMGFDFGQHGCMGKSDLVGYPSDVGDEEWAFVAPYLALCREDAPQRTHSLRAVFNGLRYIVKSGMQWRMMPHDLPPWRVVYHQTHRDLSVTALAHLAGASADETEILERSTLWPRQDFVVLPLETDLV